MMLYLQRLHIYPELNRYFISLLIGMEDAFPNKKPHFPEHGKVHTPGLARNRE
jgi:hypothetical protein